MTEQSFEYKVLRFLNDRIECYDVTDQSLKIVFYDVPSNEYREGMEQLKKGGYVKNKDVHGQGISISSDGQTKLQQLQKMVDAEKKPANPPALKHPLGLTQELFWTLLLAFIGGAFGLGVYFGSNKFDRNLIELSDNNRSLQDTIKARESTIKVIQHNSDTALDILGHMPYQEMRLDTTSFRKVQTTIENAGAFLSRDK